MGFYYDPKADMELSSEGSKDPLWIPITQSMAEALGAARKLGARIFLNSQGTPTPFFTPDKPGLEWNESAHLMPFTVVGGEGQQYWAITKISIQDQASKLAELRWIKQNTGLLYVDPETNEWTSTVDPSLVGSKYIPTDALTMTTLMGIKADFDRGINISRDWKVSSLNFVTFTNEDLAKAYLKGQEYWQAAFTIERKYAEAIVAGKNVNIYEWSL